MALVASADAVAEDLSPHAAAVAPLHRATTLNKVGFIFSFNPLQTVSFNWILAWCTRWSW